MGKAWWHGRGLLFRFAQQDRKLFYGRHGDVSPIVTGKEGLRKLGQSLPAILFGNIRTYLALQVEKEERRSHGDRYLWWGGWLMRSGALIGASPATSRGANSRGHANKRLECLLAEKRAGGRDVELTPERFLFKLEAIGILKPRRRRGQRSQASHHRLNYGRYYVGHVLGHDVPSQGVFPPKIRPSKRFFLSLFLPHPAPSRQCSSLLQPPAARLSVGPIVSSLMKSAISRRAEKPSPVP